MKEGLPLILLAAQIEHAWEVGRARHASGTPSRPLDSGLSALEGDVLGAMAEIAVCDVYGGDWANQVASYEERPTDDLTDLLLRGKRIGVKGRARFEMPLDMVVPDYDTQNHLWFLCSVRVDTGFVLIRGFITRPELLEYEPEEWKWTEDRPGARKTNKRRRYIPCEDLHPPNP